MSKGEEKIASILTKNGIKWKREIEFAGLEIKKNCPLRYDFGIFGGHNELICLLEYDSEIHFKFCKFFHKTQSNFKKRMGYDRIKNKYCLLHNIPLIRIPYWDLDDLTFNNIFTNPNYQVKTIYHNDLLRRNL